MMKQITLTLALLVAAVAATAKTQSKGDMYYEAQCYPRAFVEYMKDYAKNPDNPELLLQITRTVLLDESPRDTAVFFIEKYLSLESETIEAYYLAAQAHYHSHNFSKAQKYLNEYTTMESNKENLAKADKLQSWITNSIRMMKNKLDCRLYNLGDMINTPSSEINPFITSDDKTIFFSCDEKFNSNDVIKYFNIKSTDNVELSWTKSKAISGNVNTLYDEYVTAACGDRVFFASNRSKDFAIYESEYKGGSRLGDGMKMLEPIDRKGDETAATLTPTGDTIIFAASSEKGDLDLYYSIRIKDKWGEARPLPGFVNEPGSDENYPTLSRDGRRLYFASNREGSMGGYDIYTSDLNPKTGEWGHITQMKYPINDTYDNLTISFSSNGRYAYISSIRKEGYGGRDIYAVVFDDVDPSIAVMRCFVGIKTKQKPAFLTQPARVEVHDDLGVLVADIKINLKSSTFILPLNPGKYTITINSPEAKPLSQSIVVEEKIYGEVSMERIFILEPLQ